MRYIQQKPKRLKRYFWGIKSTHTDEDDYYWYNYDLKKWEHHTETQMGKYNYSDLFKPCRTVRAFRRHLRKHPYMKGKLRLINIYIGFDVFG